MKIVITSDLHNDYFTMPAPSDVVADDSLSAGDQCLDSSPFVLEIASIKPYSRHET